MIPRLLRFEADLLFISAGFDAHHDDFYHFLDESDIHWLTAALCEAVSPTGGRVISILEGGYSLASTAPTPTAAAAAPVAPPPATKGKKGASKTTESSTASREPPSHSEALAAKEEDSSGTAGTGISGVSPAAAGATVGSWSSLPPRAGRGKNKHLFPDSTDAVCKAPEPDRFSILPGDGGLVKG